MEGRKGGRVWRWVVGWILVVLVSMETVSGETYPVGFIYIQGDSDSEQTKIAAEIALDEVNSDKYHKFDFEMSFVYHPAQTGTTSIQRSSGNAAVLAEIVDEVVGIVGPPRTGINLVSAVTGGDFYMPTISPTATNRDFADKNTYPFFLRTIPNDQLQSQAIVDTCVYNNWNDIAILSTTDTYSTAIAQDITTFARNAGVTIHTAIYFDSGKVDLSVELNNIRSTGVRIIVTLMLVADFRTVMYNAGIHDMAGPPYVYLGTDGTASASVILNGTNAVNETVAESVYGSLATRPALFTASTEKKYKSFVKVLQKRSTGTSSTFNVSPYATYTYDAVYAMAYAIEAYPKATVPGPQNSSRPQIDTEVNGIDRRRLLNAFSLVSFTGITGLVRFDANGDRLNASYNINNFGKPGNDVLRPVGYWTPTSEVDIFDKIVWPTGKSSPTPDATPKGSVDYFDCSTGIRRTDPRGLIVIKNVDGDPNIIAGEEVCDAIIDCANWADEGFDCGSSLSIACIVLGVVAVILIIIVALYFALIFIYRRRGRIRAAGPYFLRLVCFCSVCGILTIFTYFGKAHTYVCQIRIWVWFPAAGLIVGGLSTKQFRVWRVFGNSSLKKVTFTETKLISIAALLTIPIFIILIIWTAADTYGRYSMTDDTGQHVICGSEFEILFFALLLSYLLVLLASSSVLAFITRNYPSAFSESKLIGFSLYNLTLCVCVLVPIVGVLQVQNLTAWVAAVLTVMFFFFSPITIMMCPKIWGIYITDRGVPLAELEKLPDSGTTKGTTKNTKSTSTPHSQA